MWINKWELLVSIGLFVLIWFVHIVHYPSFKYFSQRNFVKAMTFHQNRISFLVLPLMVSELIISLVQTIYFGTGELILILVLLIWIVTFMVQVPMHKDLIHNGYNEIAIAKLVRGNWIRTILWTIKLVLVFIARW